MASRNGVFYDLESSPLRSTYEGICFHFSSELHRQRFERMAVQRVEWMADSMGRRIGIEMDMGQPALIQLYRQTETRGFFVEYEGEGYRCLEDLRFAGRLLRRGDSNRRSAPSTRS